jgi:hypothetical protein
MNIQLSTKQITKLDLINLKEQIQDDICCFLDGIDDEIIDSICEIVIERVNTLIGKMSNG